MSSPISRVLSWTIIPLRLTLLPASSDLPRITTGRRIDSLFGLALSGVFPAIYVAANAVRSYRTISPLPQSRRYLFCGTFRQLTLPGRYPALCPIKPGLSSNFRQRLSGKLKRQIVEKLRVNATIPRR